ncbi:hypothetical protein BJ508DRAFT_333300 [Ascobolus immersus RN42]|uniref:Uncharacterized protein n=1 Tax=Ascobolus immersus RN42 TaxID=1160509 RepID=A0A3N4HQ65_ASCIM|nr:hypothetical protein BJ508DRAFT_333300 [Ascobolus immersus RN42]
MTSKGAVWFSPSNKALSRPPLVLYRQHHYRRYKPRCPFRASKLPIFNRSLTDKGPTKKSTAFRSQPGIRHYHKKTCNTPHPHQETQKATIHPTFIEEESSEESTEGTSSPEARWCFKVYGPHDCDNPPSPPPSLERDIMLEAYEAHVLSFEIISSIYDKAMERQENAVRQLDAFIRQMEESVQDKSEEQVAEDKDTLSILESNKEEADREIAILSEKLEYHRMGRNSMLQGVARTEAKMRGDTEEVRRISRERLLGRNMEKETDVLFGDSFLGRTMKSLIPVLKKLNGLTEDGLEQPAADEDIPAETLENMADNQEALPNDAVLQ